MHYKKKRNLLQNVKKCEAPKKAMMKKDICYGRLIVQILLMLEYTWLVYCSLSLCTEFLSGLCHTFLKYTVFSFTQ